MLVGDGAYVQAARKGEIKVGKGVKKSGKGRKREMSEREKKDE